MEDALIALVRRLRVSDPELTVRQLHTLVVEQPDFAAATFGEVKKASSKVSKQLAKEPPPALPPPPAPPPAAPPVEARDPHGLAGVLQEYGTAMRRHRRHDLHNALTALKLALHHCERTQPKDSLIRAALLDKMSMFQGFLEHKAAALAPPSFRESDDEEETSERAGADSLKDWQGWLDDAAHILLARWDQGKEPGSKVVLDLFTFSAAEWAFVDPRADNVSVFDTWCEVLGLESFLLATMRYLTNPADGAWRGATTVPGSRMLELAPYIIAEAQSRGYWRRNYDLAKQQWNVVQATSTAPILRLQRDVLNLLEARLSGPALNDFLQITRQANQNLPAEGASEHNERGLQKMRKNAAEHDAQIGRHVCALPSCGKVERHAREFQLCGRCRTAKYCCVEHQTAHWPEHKKPCRLGSVQALIYQEDPENVGTHDTWRCPVHGHKLLGPYPASQIKEFRICMCPAQAFYRCPEQGTGGCSNRGGLVGANGFGRVRL